MAPVVAAQRSIIRRPRLTSMLDESAARIRLLVAPAGYGKTTLAREWLGVHDRNDVWYRGGPASADIAALAAGVSESIGVIIANAGKRMRERLRATGNPEDDVDILAELFAEDVQSWPADAWLAIDDYHFAMGSHASERFIDLVTQRTPVQMLITSRTRPSWATARRMLYGEIVEIGRSSLAMEADEVREVVGRDKPALARFLDKARGWPAVIGLVALSSSNPDLAEAVPDRLYEYFAEELYETLSETHRVALAEISFASRFDLAFAGQVLGDTAEDAIDAGLRGGALSQFDRRYFDFHPLFADFLQERAFRTPSDKQRAVAKVGRALLEENRWDEAVDLAARFGLPDLLIETIEESLYSLLDSGRLATVTRWLETGAMLRASSPILDLAEGEVAFRMGDYPRAEGIAEHAALRLGSRSSLTSRAHFRAGYSALLRSKEQLSISYFQKARESAIDARDLREALFGLYSAMSELDLPESTDILSHLDALVLDSPDDQIRAEAVKLTHALRAGDLGDAVEAASPVLKALERAVNPLIVTSFLHVFSNASSAAGRYEQGVELAGRLLSLGSEHRLDFVRPFGVIDRAIGHLGTRSFADANHDIELTATLAPNDVHIQGNLAALRCRLLLATGRAPLAVDATQQGFLTDVPPVPLRSELLAYRALALACIGEVGQSRAVLQEAEEASRNTLVVQVLGPVLRAIAAESRQERVEYIIALWNAASSTGHIDTLVCAYRARPDLLGEIANVADRDSLSAILARANDGELGQRYGVAINRQRPHCVGQLTPREMEVMDLAATGLTNLEIAEALFIVESTVKVHLRHAYEKLGVRRRSEAVPKWLTRRHRSYEA
jgi:LuxR family transcriptional regulator, maltose regulon positive regulatory protein